MVQPLRLAVVLVVALVVVLVVVLVVAPVVNKGLFWAILLSFTAMRMGSPSSPQRNASNQLQPMGI